MPSEEAPAGRLALPHGGAVVGLDLGDELGRRAAGRVQQAQVPGRRRALLAPGDLALGERAQDAEAAADARALLAHLAELGGTAAMPPARVAAALQPGRGARPGRFSAVQAAAAVLHGRLAARAARACPRPAARRQPEVARRVAVAQPPGAARPKTLETADRAHAHRRPGHDTDPLAAGFLVPVVRPHRSLPIGPSRVANFTVKGNIFRRERNERAWASSFLSLAGETRHVEPLPWNPAAPTLGRPLRWRHLASLRRPPTESALTGSAPRRRRCAGPSR
jgi:hypothetical protein